MTLPHNDYFAADYSRARTRFLTSAQRSGAELEHHSVPGVLSPDGTPLYIDMAWLGPADADVVLLSLSGTHGAEGFCGSAAQSRWLDERSAQTLPPRAAQLLVHAVNPFGFAHMVRCNEHNVDLNRNFIDFSRPLPANPLYERLHANLPQRVGADEELVEEWVCVLERFWREHGDWTASDALSRGQFARADGLHYGGNRLQHSAEVLISRVRERCARARHIVYLDWHSLIRIGDGKLVFLCFNQAGGPLFERVGSWWGSQTIDPAAVDQQWREGVERSQRRPTRHGLLMWGMQHAVAPQADLAGAVIEFCADPDGLHGDLRSRARANVLERWLLATGGYDSPTGRYVTTLLREALSPTRRSFQEKTLDRALETYTRALDGAAAWAKEDVAATPRQLHKDTSASG